MSHTRIKLCGLTGELDLDCAVALGVDLIGLVFAPRSARRLKLDQAARLRARIPASITAVALVMDQAPAEVEAIIQAVQPDMLQFHGAEDEGFCQRFGLPYLKALGLGDGDPAQVAQHLAYWPSARGFVFDGHGAGAPGGSGQRFDWARLPRLLDKPFLLAGGLTADNVGLALKQARPWGVDVSSGIESAPGHKDHARMRAFVEAVRQADRARLPGA